MLPDHCKDVSVRDVDFELTKENILKEGKGKKAYTRTEFMVLRHHRELAIVKVDKEPGKELFRPITSIEVVSLPRDTIFVKDEGVDVLNLTQMALLARENPDKCVVVQGLFNHVSFIRSEVVEDLLVFDVVPPYPAKLSVLVDRALTAGLVDKPVIRSVRTVDLNDMEKGVGTPTIIFPCRASGITSEKNILYLDETPQIRGEAALIGCDLSRRIFQSIYRKTPDEFVSMCPRELVPKSETKRIVKCCKVREGFEIEDGMAIVPWGATVQEVAAAINALFA
ncbi:MAG TPA: hypothetical protein VLU38_02365 [Methanomassiliicoccales archaeon]|nr:hypothetical protein [Methanomassiliicoccales archaeon]